MKNTKGPWKIVEALGRYKIESDENGRTIVASVGSNDTDESRDFDNANLIAAAPEMYDLLEAFIQAPDYELENLTLQVADLLAKARGERA